MGTETDMRRREFVAFLVAAPALPLAARAQPKLPTVGFLGSGTPSSQRDQTEAFVTRLHELGWTEDRNIAIAYRWAEGHAGRDAEIAAEFVRLKVDVILASGTAAALAAKRATPVIPVVFPVVNDPLGSGLVASLARPGGNVTGLSLQNPDLAGKRLELLREAVPGLRRLAILTNAGNPGAVLEMRDIQAMLRRLGVDAVTLETRRAENIPSMFDTLKGAADALYVCSDALTIANRTRIASLALAAHLPTVNGPREFVEAGGLISYGANIPDLFRRAADYVDKILRGAKPADLPVEQPTKFDFVVNLKTAKALGLTVSPMLLARADEVIE
jgi:putative ABC transport system substrate-binding protein